MRLVMILAPGFEELEAIGTADVLKRLGIEVVTAALDTLTVTGSHDFSLSADARLAELNISEFDGVILPGGLPGSTNLLKSDLVINWVRQMFEAQKITAAICAAPIVLAKAGVLTSGRFTMYPGFDSELGGLSCTANPAETDGNIITGKGPGAVAEFARHLAESLGLKNECQELYKGMFIN